MREQIVQALKAAGCSNFVVERPRDMQHGDYSTNAALVAKLDPHELAAKLKIEGVEKIEVVGRFINFFLSPVALEPKAPVVAQFNAGKKVMVEYTQPNPFKEFHIGHLMSNTIGESITRLFEGTGAEVTRANYQGDVGVHVAKAIWAKMQKPEFSWGEAYVYGSEQYDANKQTIDALNKTIYEKSDPQVNKLYDEGRAESLAHFEILYKALGTKFDHYFFESATGPVGLKIVKAHPEVFEESEGALVFRGEQYGLHTRVFVNSQGIPTYEAKELGLAELKQQTGAYDISLTVTANEISEFYKVVRKAAELIFPNLEGRMIARFHGFLRLTTGKMSSRKGNVITGESLLADLTVAARGREDVAVGAIKYVVLRSGSGKDIVFDPEQSLSLEGDSGPYVQYALVRARALLRNAKEAKVVEGELSPAALHLCRILVHFADAVERAAKELEPHYVTTFVTELASAFNSWYGAERLIVEGGVSSANLALVQSIEQTLARGLAVLGIPTPEEM